MRKRTGHLLLIIFLLLPAPLASAPAELNRLFTGAVRQAKPSVVSIIVYQVKEKNGKKDYVRAGYGSGTIISRSGYVVTNYHVVQKGNLPRVIFPDGTEAAVHLFNNRDYYLADYKTDIAVLKIEEPENLDFEPITFEDSNDLLEGEWVIAIGNPFGLRQSITCGIVSSKGRNDIGFADIEDFIQTDVPINPGNSGGPLINLQGKLVGINTAIRTISGGYQGISFAIPSNIVRQVSQELMKYGRVRRGWLGFLARERKTGYGEKGAVEVISVIRNSPAEVSGIRSGDLIREVDGEKIASLGELIRSVGNKPVGSKLVLTISREGQLREYHLSLREKQAYQNIQRGLKSLFSLYGFELDENGSANEVIISYLSPMSLGYQSGLKRGDAIASVNGRKVGNLEEFIKIFFKSRSRISLLEIRRESRYFQIEFPGEP